VIATKRVSLLGLSLLLVSFVSVISLIPQAFPQERPVRWDFLPDPIITSAGKTRICYVEIMNQYAAMTVKFQVNVTVPQGFTVQGKQQYIESGSVPALQWREIDINIQAADTVAVGTYTLRVEVSYEVDGSAWFDARTVNIDVRTRVNIEELLKQAKENIQAWKEETIALLSPELEVTATPSLAEVKPGEPFDVTVDVKNTGTGAAENVKITLQPTDAFSLRTGATFTIPSIDAGTSSTVTFGLQVKDDTKSGSYSPLVSYEYLNALAKSLGLSASATTGSTPFSVTVKEEVKPSFLEQYLPIILGIVGALILLLIVVIVLRRRSPS